MSQLREVPEVRAVRIAPARDRNGNSTCHYCAIIAKALERPSVAPMPTPDLMWFAGLYEGEGSLAIFNSGTTRRWQLAIAMTDRDVIEKARRIAGVGSITSHARGKLHPKDERKTIFQWRVCARAEVADLIEQILPHLGSRRAAKARQALAELLDPRCKRHREAEDCQHRPAGTATPDNRD